MANIPASVLATPPDLKIVDDFIRFCANGQEREILQYIRKYGYRILECQSSEGERPLIAAAALGQTKTISLLLDLGADVNQVDLTGSTALMWAVGAPRCVEALIKNKADVNHVCHSGFTALMCAVSSEDLESVELLLEAGAHQDVADYRGKTVKARAARRGNEEMLALLQKWEDKGKNLKRDLLQNAAEIRIARLKEKRSTKPIFKGGMVS